MKNNHDGPIVQNMWLPVLNDDNVWGLFNRYLPHKSTLTQTRVHDVRPEVRFDLFAHVQIGNGRPQFC